MRRTKNKYVGARGRTEAEAQAAHLVKMQEVVEKIWPSAPKAAARALFDASFEVRSRESIDTIRPTRTEMLGLLDEAVVLINRLSEIFEVPFFSGFIASNSDMTDDLALRQTPSALAPVRSAIFQARQSSQLMKNGKLIRGAGKVLLPNEMPAKYVCAAIIEEFVEFSILQGNAKPTQKAKWAAADGIWKSWFKPDSWGDDPLTGWKEYFKAADDPSLKKFRDDLRRRLAIRVNRP